jgi:hypothetical protein
LRVQEPTRDSVIGKVAGQKPQSRKRLECECSLLAARLARTLRVFCGPRGVSGQVWKEAGYDFVGPG